MSEIITYSETRARLLVHGNPEMQAKSARAIDKMENHQGSTVEEIAEALLFFYFERKFSFEFIQGLVGYFWNPKFMQADKLFRECRSKRQKHL